MVGKNMTFNQAKKKYNNKVVSVLGRDYKISFKERWKKEDEDCCALANYEAHEIQICNKMCKEDFWYDWFVETIIHELIHCFMEESGLSRQLENRKSWVQNESAVEWFSKQLPKMVKILKELEIM